jgi:hypothetical protein
MPKKTIVLNLDLKKLVPPTASLKELADAWKVKGGTVTGLAKEIGVSDKRMRDHISGLYQPGEENKKRYWEKTGLLIFKPEGMETVASLPFQKEPVITENELVKITTNLNKQVEKLRSELDQVRVEQIVSLFETLATALRCLKGSTPEFREMIAKRIGRERLGYFASLLNGLAVPSFYNMWSDMSDHDLGRRMDNEQPK